MDAASAIPYILREPVHTQFMATKKSKKKNPSSKREKASAPALKLLGNSAAGFPNEPMPTILETFPNRSPHRDYWIQMDCAEFTSVCPVTGQPDFANLTICYIPDEECIETKSLKFYLASYRNSRSFNEEIVNQILEHLVMTCQPRCMEVQGRFGARGGISLTVDAEYHSDDFVSDLSDEDDIPF